MSRDAFELLADIFGQRLSKYSGEVYEQEGLDHRSGKITMAATKIAILIRVLSGGIPLDIFIALDFGI